MQFWTMMASSDLRSTDLGFFSDDPFKDEEIEDSVGLPETCGICDKSFTSPVILNCLHIFDLRCLGDFKVSSGLMEYIKCPKCGKIAGDIKSLEPYDTTVLRQGVLSVSDADSVLCTLCTEGKEAQYRCIQCAGTLCERCRDTHKASFHLFVHVLRLWSYFLHTKFSIWVTLKSKTIASSKGQCKTQSQLFAQITPGTFIPSFVCSVM